MLRAIQFVKSGYFHNESRQECFRSAVANLLIELDDRETARYFYDNYRSHNLVIDGGVNNYLSTRVINDIIGDKYRVKLFIRVSNNLTDYFGIEKIKIIEEEIEQKRIINVHEEMVSVDLPLIVAFRKGEIAHAVVCKEDRTYIDDGIETLHKDLDILGVITLNNVTYK